MEDAAQRIHIDSIENCWFALRLVQPENTEKEGKSCNKKIMKEGNHQFELRLVQPENTEKEGKSRDKKFTKESLCQKLD
eukprot:545454-Amorphochlora_amoeboformis.AAC.2